jgi:YD repeat-containing protein
LIQKAYLSAVGILITIVQNRNGSMTETHDFVNGVEYEKSPLQRVLSARAGGWLQKPTSEYLFNNSIDVPGYEANTLYKTQVTDENRVVSYQFKDKLGQLILSRRIIGRQEELPVETRYQYDYDGKLLTVYDPNTNQPELAYRYTYYTNGLLWTKHVPQKGMYQYTYDANYRMDTETLPDGTILQYTYNDYDQQSAVWNITNASNQFKLHEFEYYPNNDNAKKKRLKTKKTLILANNNNALTYLETTYLYDALGRTQSEVVQHHKNGSDTYLYTYDHRDRMSTVTRTHTNGSTTTILAKRFNYDHANRLKAVFLQRNTDPEIQLNGMDYNEKDQLIRKKLG